MDTKLTLKRGDITRIAKESGVTPQAAWQWFKVGSRVPAKHVGTVCKILGVKPENVRPDIFEIFKGVS